MGQPFFVSLLYQSTFSDGSFPLTPLYAPPTQTKNTHTICRLTSYLCLTSFVLVFTHAFISQETIKSAELSLYIIWMKNANCTDAVLFSFNHLLI